MLYISKIYRAYQKLYYSSNQK